MSDEQYDTISFMTDEQYDTRPRAVAAELTKRDVQPPVMYMDAWRIFAYGISGGNESREEIQVNVYCTCIGLDGHPALSYQTCLLMPAAAAIRLGAELLSHAVASSKKISRAADIGVPDLSLEVRSLVDKRMSQLQEELKVLFQEPKA